MAAGFQDVLNDKRLLAEALQAITLTPKERKDLELLYRSDAGIPVRRDANNVVRGDTVSSCSRIGKKLTVQLGGIRPRDLMMWLGDLHLQPSGEERWHLKPQLRLAIDQLEWFSSATASAEPTAAQSEPSLDHIEESFRRAIARSANDTQTARLARLEQAPAYPARTMVTTTSFARNPDVVAEALFRAKGTCEQCKRSAPFIRALDNTPYLEIHHKVRLSYGGPDTLGNVIALCPNCHRKAHYGQSTKDVA